MYKKFLEGTLAAALAVVVIGSAFWAADVDAKSFRCAEDVVVHVAHFNFGTIGCEYFYVEAERMFSPFTIAS